MNMNPYLQLVSECASNVRKGRNLPLGEMPNAPRPQIAPDAPKVLFIAPHPDDETIIGGLALRLLREAKWNVIDVAVTQGRIEGRKAERLKELRNACSYLGFGLVQCAPNGLDDVTVKTRDNNPKLWESHVEIMAKILSEHRPKVILFPHELDWNGTHIGVHFQVMDALKKIDLNCYIVETEFWGQMQTPNLLVEYTENEVADLVAATSFHVGEVKRNPYHLLMPAWMQDNVRRGSELVGGQGGAAADFMFAQAYRLQRWNGGKIEPCFPGGRFLPTSTNASTLFP
jgi:LmbE family N-acetylglucosaminyl deacetylase